MSNPAGNRSTLGCLRAADFTSAGLVRKNNEDASFVDERLGLFIVSDGMGGEQAGEIAAQMVTTVLPRMIRTHLAQRPSAKGPTIRSWLKRDLLALSQTMHRESSTHPMAEGMGATAVLALVKCGWAHVAHMGDSRAYLFRKDVLVQVTQDHSVVNLLLHAGEICETEARKHPARGRLTRFVGMKEQVYADVRSIALFEGDRLLLCTDGLSGMIPDSEIRQILVQCLAPAEACRELVNAANRAGGRDNVSALLVQVGRANHERSVMEP